MRPLADVSRGPVKTSPDGMLRLPSLLTQVRLATLSRRSVPSASMRSSEACETRAISASWNSDSSPQPRTGSGRSRNRARLTNAANAPSSIPASAAPAGVGHSVEHQRFLSIWSRTSRRPRAARVISSGSTEASARASSGAWMPTVASIRRASS